MARPPDVAYFEDTLAADPSLARAHAGIAQAYHWLASYGSLSFDEGFSRARAAAQRALELDDRLAEAHLALGQVQFGYDWDFRAARRSFHRALELAPAHAESYRLYGHFLQMMGRHAAAIETRAEAVRLDPLSLTAHLGLADSCFCAGRLRDAARVLERIAELDPEFPVHHLRARIELARDRPRHALRTIEQDRMAWRRRYIGAMAWHRLGDTARARAELNELIESHGDDAALQIALVYSQIGDRDRAFEWLRKAYAQRDPGMIELRADPELEPLCEDERFRSLEAKMGFLSPAGNADA